MKHLLFSLILIVLVGKAYSQKTTNDTAIFKTIRSPWAIKFETGILAEQRQGNFHSDFTNNIAQVTGVTISYKNYFFYYDGYIQELKPKKNVVFDGNTFDDRVQFSLVALSFALGYNYDFNKNWGTNVKLGLHSTSFETSNYNDIGKYYKSDIVTGTRLGLGVNRYFNVGGFNYIVIGLAADYYSTNYRSISQNLSNSFMNYALTVGYKGWFRKVIK